MPSPADVYRECFHRNDTCPGNPGTWRILWRWQLCVALDEELVPIGKGIINNSKTPLLYKDGNQTHNFRRALLTWSRLVLGYCKIQSNTKCQALSLKYETHSYRVVSMPVRQCRKEPADLLSHGLRICYGSTKVPVPLQSAVQPRPVIVSVSRMRKAPWYKSVKLAVSGITWLAFCAWAYAT